MSSAEMDRRAVRLALGLTIAGALMLTAGVATWLITTVGRVTSGMAARDLRLASLALLAGGVVCGVGMGFALASAGRAQPGGPAVPGDGTGLAHEAPESAGPAPSLAEPWSLMNPPLPDPPPLDPPSGDARPADRVWWRSAHSPSGGWDDTSEEWLRSLRGPAIQQPPPHSAE
ncbi:MAG: hypothetical protein ACRDMI_16755 [Streptosporangiaceae bacterium]